MSVIVARALPDVRDGLKPVHRRVLFGMQDLGSRRTAPYKKSARIVGEVLGKYHPHGDTRGVRHDGAHGAGFFDALSAGGRAGELRLGRRRLRRGHAVHRSPALPASPKRCCAISRRTRSTSPRTSTTRSRSRRCSRRMVPNLLVNGSSGIAVGMATNIPPHNLSEVIDGCIALIEDETLTNEKLMKFIKAPDFPTGGIIYGYEGVKERVHHRPRADRRAGAGQHRNRRRTTGRASSSPRSRIR